MEHEPYKIKFNREPDFIVEYEWCSDTYVKRYQGMRSDYLYTENEKEDDFICMIWPEFLDEKGRVILNKETELDKKGYANMWVMMDERRPYHKQRIKEGVVGYMVGGSEKIAKTVVIQVGSLNDKL